MHIQVTKVIGDMKFSFNVFNVKIISRLHIPMEPSREPPRTSCTGNLTTNKRNSQTHQNNFTHQPAPSAQSSHGNSKTTQSPEDSRPYLHKPAQ